MDSELFKIVLTSSLTVFGGIMVFVGGQLVTRFFIDPIHEQDKLLGEIANLLILYANVSYIKGNPPAKDSSDWKQIEDMSQELRRISGRLRGATYSMRAYWLFQKFQLVRLNRDEVLEISKSLIGWSNFLISGDNKIMISAQKTIGKILKVDINS